MITADQLYELLPAIYRIRDAERGEPLKALVSILAEQANVVDQDIERLYDNWFIETCDEWVVPYIGDLLGVRGLHPITAATFSQRARVANTLGYRRRKGTATMLEQLARDVTGWPARAVEYFELLQTTQHFNHIRLHSHRTPDLRDTNALELIGTPFEKACRTAEVRRIARGRGLYNIPNVGIWLWRLQSYPVTRGTARLMAAGQYTFNPLGYSAPLFNEPQSEAEITHLAQERNVPGQLRRLPLYRELKGRRSAPPYFGDDPVLEVYLDNTYVAPEDMVICNLEDWHQPQPPVAVAVDPVLGRLTLPAGVEPTTVEVSYSYGFSADMGGGPYDRGESVGKAIRQTITFQRGVQATAPAGDGLVHQSIIDALAEWNAQPAGTVGLICVMDSRTYEGDLTIDMKPGSTLYLVAADWPDRETGSYAADDVRPHVRGNVAVTGDAGSLIVDGLLIEGTFSLSDDCVSRLGISNCTLVPTSGGLSAPNLAAAIEIDRSIWGDIVLGVATRDLKITDSSAVSVAAKGASAILERCTLTGSIAVRSLEASECIFVDSVEVERRQIGCMRFCYVRDLPATPKPRRYRCQPDLALKDIDDPAEQARIRARITPVFNSIIYGEPDYLQLANSCATEILTGAEDGSEMGVFCSLKQPLRIANLRASLDEYLRFGLEAGIFLVT